MAFVFLLLIVTLVSGCAQKPSTLSMDVTPSSPALSDPTEPLPTVSLTPTIPLATQTRTRSATTQVLFPTLSSDAGVTPTATMKHTVTSLTQTQLIPHTTTGIHLSLQTCEETKHFVLYCTDVDKTVATVIALQLENDFERITTQLNHQPPVKIKVEIYSNLQSFHAAVGHQHGLEWFVGNASNRLLRMVTPLNPGPKHSFDTLMQTTTHELTHLIVDEITGLEIPDWLDEGIATYESGQRQAQFVAARMEYDLPGIADLNFNAGTDTGTIYAFSYTIVEFIVQEFGYDRLVALVASAGNLEETLGMSETEFEKVWQHFVVAEYKP
jgi:hypothetical protein